MCAREREKKHIAQQGLQSLCAPQKEKYLHRSLLRRFFYTCISPREPPQAPRPIRSVGDAESPFLSQITAHAHGDRAGRPCCQSNAFLTFDHDVSAA